MWVREKVCYFYFSIAAIFAIWSFFFFAKLRRYFIISLFALSFGTRCRGNSAVHSHQHVSILNSWTWELLEIILGRSQELATMHFLVVGSDEALRFVILIAADGG